MAIADYLVSLVNARDQLLEILRAKGITVNDRDKINTLIERVADISTAENSIETALYSFGVLSDIHLKDDSFGEDENQSIADYRKALTFFKHNNADFIAIPGDIVANNRTAGADTAALLDAQNEWVSELRMFTNLNAACFPAKPVYCCTGNHDATPHGYYVAYTEDNADTEGMNIPVVASGFDGSKTAEQVWKEIIGTDIHHVIHHKGDVFIFFSMYYWYYAKFCRDTDIEWLRDQLEANQDKRVFLFFHVPMQNTFSFTNNTSCWSNAAQGFQSNVTMGALVASYQNVIWFSGHTHYDLTLEGAYENSNTFLENGMTMIHCPSLAYPRLPDGDSYVNIHEGAQGYLVDVYCDRIVVKGIDFGSGDTGVFLPAVSYIVDT